MIQATISADIVSSTALSVEELSFLQSEIRQFLERLSEKSQGKDWGRLFKGDSVEIILFDPHGALKTALLLKTLVKKTSIAINRDAKRELFKRYGIRLAIGIGEMRTADKVHDILDGEAIYYSGRLLEKAMEEKQTNKRSMFFACKDPMLTEQMDVILGLLDALLKEATPRQSEILYYKILGMNESEIAQILQIKQPVVNRHKKSLNWKSIESAVKYFEKLNFES